MYIERVPNRNSPPAVLLRESYREDGRVRKRTIANLSDLPDEMVENLRIVLKGGIAMPSFDDAFDIERSLPHGHVAAVLGSLQKCGLDKVLAAKPCPERDRVVAMIAARILDPRSKLATARGLAEETLAHSLGEELAVSDTGAEALYAAMDWLVERQEEIEQRLGAKHLEDGALVLYDVSSTYFEGRSCPLAERGYSRDNKSDKLQIVFGLLCNREGCPVAVDVFEGNSGDPTTVKSQIEKLRERFGLERVVLVGDRGMITQTVIDRHLRDTVGLDWITALRAETIRKLAEGGPLQLSLFDETDLAEITSEEFPNERLVVCKNPLLAEDRTRTREELLCATERELDKIVAATERSKRALKGQDQIGLRVGKVINHYRVGKHFVLTITDTQFSYRRNTDSIEAEAALDGIYVLRTTVPKTTLDGAGVVRAYKDLAGVERAFRALKSVDLKVRPIYHRLADRVRAHVFLCMLAYYVEWHMRQRVAPILFDDDDKLAGEALRTSIVAPAKPSPAAKKKAATRRTEEDLPVHSFQSLLSDLATIVKNRIKPTVDHLPAFDRTTKPTPLQRRAFKLLGIRL